MGMGYNRYTIKRHGPGKVNAFSTVNAQVSCKFPVIKSTVKVGADNLLNRQIYQAYGSASIGAIYYMSLTFDEMLRWQITE